jgi:hypothetical protein
VRRSNFPFNDGIASNRESSDTSVTRARDTSPALDCGTFRNQEVGEESSAGFAHLFDDETLLRFLEQRLVMTGWRLPSAKDSSWPGISHAANVRLKAYALVVRSGPANRTGESARNDDLSMLAQKPGP